MKAFIGRFTWSEDFDIMTVMMEKKFCISLPMLEFFFSFRKCFKASLLKIVLDTFPDQMTKKNVNCG